MDRSRRLRSRMRFCAVCASFQNCGDSDLAFSSSSRRTDLSQSKMPPQQGERLLDLFDGPLGLAAHCQHPSVVNLKFLACNRVEELRIRELFRATDIRVCRLARNALNSQVNGAKSGRSANP